LVVSDDHESIKAAVAGELPGSGWQRCTVHFERNVLSHVPATSIAEVAQDLKAIFKVRREKTARALGEEFVELYSGRLPKAVSVFEAGIADTLTYLSYPGLHHTRIRTTNMLERVFEEIKRRTRVVGVFPNEMSASTLATEIALRSSEQWALRRYLRMERSRSSRKTQPTTFETLTERRSSEPEVLETIVRGSMQSASKMQRTSANTVITVRWRNDYERRCML
jgi:putative transposase